ncbi:MAG TPA: helix-turn-helix domain-containing protein [Thermoplasmata archaeon]|nr:helix-turn-helix domain-containing protein [Thermoplasmata archaeon]
MSSPDPRPALEALASEHGLPILRFLRGRGWVLSSQVAEGLGIHTTTASKHLAAFHEAGFLERRVHASKRSTHAYRLASPIVRLELNLAEAEPDAPDVFDACAAFVDALLSAAQRVGGSHLSATLVSALFGASDWRPVLRGRIDAARNPRAVLEGLVRAAHDACTAQMGAVAAGRLLRIAIDAASEGRSDLFSASAEVAP